MENIFDYEGLEAYKSGNIYDTSGNKVIGSKYSLLGCQVEIQIISEFKSWNVRFTKHEDLAVVKHMRKEYTPGSDISGFKGKVNYQYKYSYKVVNGRGSTAAAILFKNQADFDNLLYQLDYFQRPDGLQLFND